MAFVLPGVGLRLSRALPAPRPLSSCVLLSQTSALPPTHSVLAKADSWRKERQLCVILLPLTLPARPCLLQIPRFLAHTEDSLPVLPSEASLSLLAESSRFSLTQGFGFFSCMVCICFCPLHGHSSFLRLFPLTARRPTFASLALRAPSPLLWSLQSDTP